LSGGAGDGRIRRERSENGVDGKRGKREGRKAGFRLWIQYLSEKRTAIFLYFGTVLLFVATCCLYHMENAGKLLYAALLTFVLWAWVGVARGIRYVRKCRALEAAAEQFEQTKELNLKEFCGAEETGGNLQTVEQRLTGFLHTVDESRMREEADRQEKEADRRDYFLMWAHQVKTPIAAMKLLLEEAGDCKNNFRMREELFKIEQYAEMVLTIQRLDSMASDLELREYELAPLLRQAVRKYSVLFINKGLQVEVSEGGCRVLTDEKWFSFCLEQILSNGIKYTEKGRITASYRDNEDCAILWIEDTGMGIRQEDLPRIFDKGFTGYNGRVDKRATGIGLYLCKKICGQLGIRIEVASRLGEGTRVTFFIPRAQPHDD